MLPPPPNWQVVTEACATRPELVDVPRLAAAATALRAQWRAAKALKHPLAPSLLDVRVGWGFVWLTIVDACWWRLWSLQPLLVALCCPLRSVPPLLSCATAILLTRLLKLLKAWWRTVEQCPGTKPL